MVVIARFRFVCLFGLAFGVGSRGGQLKLVAQEERRFVCLRPLCGCNGGNNDGWLLHCVRFSWQWPQKMVSDGEMRVRMDERWNLFVIVFFIFALLVVFFSYFLTKHHYSTGSLKTRKMDFYFVRQYSVDLCPGPEPTINHSHTFLAQTSHPQICFQRNTTNPRNPLWKPRVSGRTNTEKWNYTSRERPSFRASFSINYEIIRGLVVRLLLQNSRAPLSRLARTNVCQTNASKKQRS